MYTGPGDTLGVPRDTGWSMLGWVPGARFMLACDVPDRRVRCENAEWCENGQGFRFRSPSVAIAVRLKLLVGPTVLVVAGPRSAPKSLQLSTRSFEIGVQIPRFTVALAECARAREPSPCMVLVENGRGKHRGCDGLRIMISLLPRV